MLSPIAFSASVKIGSVTVSVSLIFLYGEYAGVAVGAGVGLGVASAVYSTVWAFCCRVSVCESSRNV